MSAALSTPLVICKAGLLRTSSKRHSTSFGAPRPSIFRNSLSQRDSFATFSLGGGPGGENRKVLRREDEPEEYWTSEAERKGVSPWKDPLALIGIAAIFLPFVILGVAIATGLVDLQH